MLITTDDLEQATIDALQALGHLGLLAGAHGYLRFGATVEHSLTTLVETVQIDLSQIGDVAESSRAAEPPR